MQGEAESEGPSESECRPYIEKALKELEGGDAGDDDSKEDVPTVEITTDDSDHDGDDDAQESAENELDDQQSSENNEEVLFEKYKHNIDTLCIFICFRQKTTVVTKNPLKMKMMEMKRQK